MHTQPKLLTLACALLLSCFAIPSAQADCIDGPKRSPRGWTQWTKIDSSNGVDLEVRYRSKFSLPGSAGRETTMIQFRYVNRTLATKDVSLVINGQKIDGSAFFWNRESYYIEPFGLQETGRVEGRTAAEGEVSTLAGRICKYTVDFRAY